MLGMVFTELHEFVEATCSFDVADDVLAQSGLSGAWAATGLYQDVDLGRYVEALSARTGAPVADLVHAYGAHLLTRFCDSHPAFFEGRSTRSFLEGIESKIHSEVRRLWPAAKTPVVSVVSSDDDAIEVEYRSDRGLAMLALGLLEQTTRHFDDGWSVTTHTMNADHTRARFQLTRRHEGVASIEA